jgi:hypothetical protein
MNPANGEMCTYETESGKSDYTWSVTGGSILMGQGTRFLAVKWENVNAEGHISVYYTADNACVTSPTDSTVTMTTTTDATLQNLVVSEGTLSPAFNASITNYTVDVINSVTSITITATANDANATVSGDGAKSLNVGANTFNIVVTAKDGTTKKTYTVIVTRVASNDATLSNLSVNEGTLLPLFSQSIFAYTVEVENEIENITINATPNHPNATVSGTGTKTLIEGTNNFGIVVTAENNTTSQTYNLVINRKNATGIEKTPTNQLIIYPNPVKDYLYIRFEKPIEKIEIYNQSGICALTENNPTEKLNVATLTNGFYLVRIYIGGILVTQKIFIRK